MRFAEACIFKI